MVNIITVTVDFRRYDETRTMDWVCQKIQPRRKCHPEYLTFRYVSILLASCRYTTTDISDDLS